MDDYLWLTSEAAEPWLRRAAHAAADPLALVSQLRRDLSADRARLVAEQVELRRRAAAKFSRAETMFFTRKALEQATDEAVARYKAAKLPAAGRRADVCCGIGGDLLALAAAGQAVGIERDPVIACLARANLAARGLAERAEVCQCDAAETDVASFTAWHCDPDRRPQTARTTRVANHQPPAEVIEALLARQPAAALKLAPGGELPENWQAAAEAEWISRDGQCRQLVAWFGPLADSSGRRRATIVDASGRAVASLVGRGDRLPPVATQLGGYVYDIDAAVLAARLQAELAESFELQSLAPGVGYLTGESLAEHPALMPFELRDTLPFDLRQLRGWVRQHGIGRLELKKRGVEVELEQLRRQLRPAGDNAATLIITPWAGQVVVLWVHRIAAGA